jgi:hypothetical protein
MGRALTRSEGRALAVLTRAAEAGAPCPSNAELAAAAEVVFASASAVLVSLGCKGRVKIERQSYNGPRRVVIVESGKATDWAMPNLPRLNALARLTAEARALAKLHGWSAPEPQDRDPCCYCGTRPEYAADFGCRQCKPRKRA